MGQKINPVGLRLGINRTWSSRWFAGRGEYGKLLHEDLAIRAYLMQELVQWYDQGKIKPVIDCTMPMAELHNAYARMASRQVQGKLVLVNA